MAIETPDFTWAAGVCSSDGTTIWANECQVAKTGTGTYTVTLDHPLDSTECSILVTHRGAQSFAYAPSVVHTSDSVKTLTFNTGTTAQVLTDTAWDVLVCHKPKR